MGDRPLHIVLIYHVTTSVSRVGEPDIREKVTIHGKNVTVQSYLNCYEFNSKIWENSVQ